MPSNRKESLGKTFASSILKALQFSVLHLLRDEELIYGFVCRMKRRIKTLMMMDVRRLYSALITFQNYPLKDNFEYDLDRVNPSIVDTKEMQF